jgi:hypothetical protein
MAIESLQLWTEQMMALGGDIGKAAYGREMAKCEKQAFRKRAELRGEAHRASPLFVFDGTYNAKPSLFR